VTDARFPERWLNDRRVRRLSDPAFRLYVISLTWSVSNRTDGVLYPDDLSLLADVDPARAGEMEKSELWRRVKDYWLITEFEDTQSTREQLEGLDRKRRLDRERKARQRARERSNVTQDVTRDTKDRTGQDRTGAVTREGEDDDPPDAAQGHGG
jgi:hypothetical protein